MKSFQQNTQTHTHIKQNTPKPSRENQRQLLLYRTNTPILLFFFFFFSFSALLSFVRRFLSAAVPATAPDTNAGFLLVRADPLSRNLAIEILFFSFSFSLFIFFPFGGEKRKSKHKSMLTISRLAIQPVTRLQKTQGGIPKNSPKEKQKRKKNSSHVYHTKCVSSPSCRSLRFFFSLGCPFEILLLSEKRRKSKSIWIQKDKRHAKTKGGNCSPIHSFLSSLMGRCTTDLLSAIKTHFDLRCAVTPILPLTRERQKKKERNDSLAMLDTPQVRDTKKKSWREVGGRGGIEKRGAVQCYIRSDPRRRRWYRRPCIVQRRLLVAYCDLCGKTRWTEGKRKKRTEWKKTHKEGRRKRNRKKKGRRETRTIYILQFLYYIRAAYRLILYTFLLYMCARMYREKSRVLFRSIDDCVIPCQSRRYSMYRVEQPRDRLSFSFLLRETGWMLYYYYKAVLHAANHRETLQI